MQCWQRCLLTAVLAPSARSIALATSRSAGGITCEQRSIVAPGPGVDRPSPRSYARRGWADRRHRYQVARAFLTSARNISTPTFFIAAVLAFSVLHLPALIDLKVQLVVTLW